MSQNAVKIEIATYQGKNPNVIRMSRFLASRLPNDLYGAIVHGSLGTYEEINFSDFDALVIIKDAVFKSRNRLINVGHLLNLARIFMFDQDPLQHHGWFVLTEFELRHHCLAFFPIDLLKYAKSLFPETNVPLEINYRNSKSDILNSFFRITRSIKLTIFKKKFRNMYTLKSLLSRFMLLPSLYLQLRHPEGIFKKYSFTQVRNDFSRGEWAIMDKISEIRKNWHFEMTPAMKLFLYLHINPIVFSKLQNKTAPYPPSSLKNCIPDSFFTEILDFVNLIELKALSCKFN